MKSAEWRVIRILHSVFLTPHLKLADPKGFAPSTLPQTTGRSALSYGSKNGLPSVARRERRMVGSAGNAPVVATDMFRDVRVTAGLSDHFPNNGLPSVGLAKDGCRGGSRTHRGRAYETHLNLILPALEMVEAAGNAPAWVCLQGRYITFLPHPRLKNSKSENRSPNQIGRLPPCRPE